MTIDLSDDWAPSMFGTSTAGSAYGNAPPIPHPFHSHVWATRKQMHNPGWILNHSAVFEKHGACPVRVTVAGEQTPFYGLLALLPIYNTAESGTSARQIYRIRVPKLRVEQARHGRISVVFAPYRYHLTGHYRHTWYETMAWILWLSDAPFTAKQPPAPPPGKSSAATKPSPRGAETQPDSESVKPAEN